VHGGWHKKSQPCKSIFLSLKAWNEQGFDHNCTRMSNIQIISNPNGHVVIAYGHKKKNLHKHQIIVLMKLRLNLPPWTRVDVMLIGSFSAYKKSLKFPFLVLN